MSITKQEWIELEKKASELRLLTLETCHWAGSGHMGGSMSIADMLTLLYYKHLNFDPKNYEDPDRDRCVVSKGHVGIIIAPLFSMLGLLDQEELKTFNLTNSKLGIHLDYHKVKGLEASTGSLGHGSALALGMTLAGRVNKKDYKSVVILGDGECNEGSVWEAAMATSHFKATNLITIVDRNKCMIDGRTEDVMSLEPFPDKWTAFGFETIVVNGHNMAEMSLALDKAWAAKDKPVCLILDTFKGEGVSFMKDDYKWHYGAMDDDKYNLAKQDLIKYGEERIARAEKEGQ